MSPPVADPPTPGTQAQSAARAILQRAHAEAHDVYVPDGSPVDSSLSEACTALFRALRFEEGIARARRDAGWESHAESRLYVGIGMHYQRRYADARTEYAAAMALSAAETFRSSCASNIAATWFEEGDLARADAVYDEALAVDPLNECALLGRVAVACQRDEPEAAVEAARAIPARWPAWRTRTVLTTALLKDRSLRLLRDAPGLFERALGVTPLDLLRADLGETPEE